MPMSRPCQAPWSAPLGGAAEMLKSPRTGALAGRRTGRLQAQWKPSVPVLGDHSVRSADALQRYALPSVDYVPERRTSSSPA